MKSTWLKRICTMTLAFTALSTTTAVFAQYIWLDEKGGKLYSDTPPPPSVPKNRILKEPYMAPRTPPQGASAEASASASAETTAESGNKAEAASASAAAKAAAAKSLAERNADFQKRKAEKEKKDADDAKANGEKAKNCEVARAYQRNLDSGKRVASVDKNGEQVFMSDEKRAQEIKNNRQILDDCK